jgi:hypothetical protein
MQPRAFESSANRQTANTTYSDQKYAQSPHAIQGSLSPGQGFTAHSWASFSAGHFYVFCNSFLIEPSTGIMTRKSATATPTSACDPRCSHSRTFHTASLYIPHEPFSFNVSQGYTSPIDGINEKRSGVSGTFFSNIPNGYFGNIPFSNLTSLSAASCCKSFLFLFSFFFRLTTNRIPTGRETSVEPASGSVYTRRNGPCFFSKSGVSSSAR